MHVRRIVSRLHVGVCVCELDLHIFHTDPLVIGENGPYRHGLDTLLFLREAGAEKKKRWRKLNHKTLLPLFYNAPCATCTGTGGVMSPPRGTKQRSRNSNPMCYLSKNHTNIDVAARAAGDKGE